MANQIPESTTTRPAADDPYTKATHSSASDPHPMPPRQISEKELADKALAAERPAQAAGKNAGKTGQPLATSTGDPLDKATMGRGKNADTPRKDDTKKAAPVKGDHALEQAHKEKVEREKDIMRDPHEDEEKAESGGWKQPMPKYGVGKDSVSALRISELRPVSDNKTQLVFTDARFTPIEVDAPWITAHRPVAGGWYVVDGSGRRFLNATDFEHRYRKAAVA